MTSWLRDRFAVRPWWMNAMMIFCAYYAFIHFPYDFLIKPLERDQEAWFGFLVYGWAAKLTEPLHAFIYGAGAYGFWRMRRWMWPWASLYVWQIAIGMVVWNALYPNGRGLLGALIVLPLFAIPAIALWRARPLFEKPRRPLRERYGQWALVTGASAGIGAEFARALAREGVSCVLTARREDRLRELATELERQPDVSTKVIAADLGDPAGAEKLLRDLGDLPIDIFINNAGLGYAGRFDKLEPARVQQLVQVNCVAPTMLALALLPGMRTRGRGAMIVSGSVAGHQPLPRHAIYAASKAYDRLFGEALWAEYRGTGVDVIVLEPGPTVSEFRQVAGELRDEGEPAANVVTVAFEALGQQPSVVSGWFNWLRACATRFVPRSVVTLLAEQVIVEQTPLEMR